MGSIVTFYSYKGGVGRSMSLANVALLLARRGKRVLVVDFDLEAPGLERYFSCFQVRSNGLGLLRMFMSARDDPKTDFRLFTSEIACETRFPIALLPSGRELDSEYSKNLESFDWPGFFGSHRGGEFVEALRDQWRDAFDVVLVDSRTGLSDTGGICTIQLPDIVVAMFTANFQSLYGVRDVMRLAQRARQNLGYDRMPLTVIPLPTRWGTQEFQETEVWMDRVVDGMEEFYRDWLPRPLTPRDVVERLKVPQRDYFSFGEKLAVVEQSASDPLSMGFVYDRVAAFIASDCSDIGALLGSEAAASAKKESRRPRQRRRHEPAPVNEYVYDVFVSYENSLSTFVLEFVDALKADLRDKHDDELKVFADRGELQLRSLFEEYVQDALVHSKVLVALLTPAYVNSDWAMSEFLTFRHRRTRAGAPPVVPVVVVDGAYPASIESLRSFELRTQSRAAWSRSGQYRQSVGEIAERVRALVDEAPTYDPDWTAVAIDGVFAEGLSGFAGLSRLMDGTWHGTYNYEEKHRQKAETFVLTVDEHAGEEFRGTTTESGNLGDARVKGRIDEKRGVITFEKKYNKSQHVVRYAGAHVGDRKVKGKWFVPGASGAFEMSADAPRGVNRGKEDATKS